MNGIKTRTEDPRQEMIEAATEFLESRYQDATVEAVREQADAVHIAYSDLFEFDPDFADDLIDSPRPVLAALRRGLSNVAIPVPGEEGKLTGMDVRVHGVDAPETVVSQLRREPHLGRYLGVRGQVSHATQVKPKLMQGMFRCERCSATGSNYTIGPVPQLGDELTVPDQCPGCERQGPFSLIQDESDYLDHQIVELADPPGENPGQSGDVIPVHLYGDVAGEPVPGDRVRVNGVVDTEHQIIRSANVSIDRRQDWLMSGHSIDNEEQAFEEIVPERVEEITALSNRDDLVELFVDSVAPDILTGDRGDKHKLALLLALFGGCGDDERADINLFYIGAPGTGKSHYLQRAQTLAPKAVQASGKGATAAGLTATATKSDVTGKWVLSAGALVLASGGVACIDEFDKMADSTRQSMHEAMENQEVPINKAGINTTLTTETTVIAAANPKYGRFDRYEPLNEQVELGSPLLSRFDLIFGISDSVDSDRDEAIAEHQHNRSADEATVKKPLDDDLMTEYIAYARQNVMPTYADDAPKQHLIDYYTEKRKESDDGDPDVSPVTPRMNDALRRLAQASARLHLRDEITMADAECATDLMNLTLGDTALEADGTLNYGKREGRNVTQEQRKDMIQEAVADESLTVEEIADATGLDDSVVEDEVDALATKGELYQPQTGEYQNT